MHAQFIQHRISWANIEKKKKKCIPTSDTNGWKLAKSREIIWLNTGKMWLRGKSEFNTIAINFEIEVIFGNKKQIHKVFIKHCDNAIKWYLCIIMVFLLFR